MGECVEGYVGQVGSDGMPVVHMVVGVREIAGVNAIIVVVVVVV